MLNFTKNEKTALIVIASVILLSAVIQLGLSHKPNPAYFDYSVQDSIFTIRSADTIKTVKKISSQSAKEQSSKSGFQILEIEKKVKKGRQPDQVELKKKSININTATIKALCRLPGIGPKTAQKIIEYRNQYGKFKSVNELTQVKGIGEKKLLKIWPYVFVENSR